jgi:tetratricopeptide (TPR) repeat protein
MRRLRVSVLLAVLVMPLTAAAQSAVARVTGTVRDEAGKPLSGATITATNPDQTPSTFTATTDDKGRFGMLGLRRGTWVFAIAAPGFQTLRATGEVQTGRSNPPLNVKLLGVPPPAGPTANISGAEIQSAIDAAEAAAAAGDTKAAVANYRQVLIKVPALTTAYLRIGALLAAQGDTAAALEAYRELAKIDPGNTQAAAAIARLAAPR